MIDLKINQEPNNFLSFNGIDEAFLPMFISKDLKLNNKDADADKEKLKTIINEKNVSFIKDSYLQYNRIDQNKRFDNFLTGVSNKLAYEASIKVSENISHYNPLYIYGGVGMGKRHILNAIGLELKKKQ